MDSTSVVASILNSVDVQTLAILTGVIGVFHPYITDLFNGLWFDKIVNEKVRKSSIWLFSTLVGFVIALVINYSARFGLSVFICFLIGGGLYTTIGEGAYRLRKALAKESDV